MILLDTNVISEVMKVVPSAHVCALRDSIEIIDFLIHQDTVTWS